MARLCLFFLFSLLLLIQYPLWLGKGGWLDVWELQRIINAQIDYNKKLEIRNLSLESQVKDLKAGNKAIEELARTELGMVREGEKFFRITGESRVLPLNQD